MGIYWGILSRERHDPFKCWNGCCSHCGDRWKQKPRWCAIGCLQERQYDSLDKDVSVNGGREKSRIGCEDGLDVGSEREQRSEDDS